MNQAAQQQDDDQAAQQAGEQVAQLASQDEVDQDHDPEVQRLQGPPGLHTEYGDLTERVIAEVPGPRLGDSQGWAAIDRVGAWDAHLSRFSTMEECPPQYKYRWTKM